MQRDGNTGRFVKEDKPPFTGGNPQISFSYATVTVLIVLAYPWLVILLNNSSSILNLLRRLNRTIIDGIKEEGPGLG